MTWMSSSNLNDMPDSTQNIPAHLIPGTAIAHRYILQQRLTAGTAPEIWLAHDQASNSTVWLHRIRLGMCMPESDQLHIRTTLRHVMNSPHPRIVRIHSVEFFETVSYIATDPLHEPLSVRLSKGRLRQSEAIHMLRHITAGLAHLHAHNVPCGILTPGGIDHTENGTLLAFAGLSELLPLCAQPFPIDTQFRPGYQPPELKRGVPYSLQSDYFQYGALMWELLIGTPPPDQPLTVLAAGTAIPPLLCDILASCLHALPEERTISFNAVLAVLRKVDRDLQGTQFLNTIVRMPTVPNTATHKQPASDSFHPATAKQATQEAAEPLFPQHTATNARASSSERHQTERLPVFESDHIFQERDQKKPVQPTDSTISDIRALLEENANTLPRRTQITYQTSQPFQNIVARLHIPQGKKLLQQTGQPVRYLGLIAATILISLAIWSLGISKALAGHSQTQVAGDVTISDTLTTIPARATPYRITRPIILGPGQTLAIQAGATLAFNTGTGIIIRGGTLDAEGTATQPVILTAIQDATATGQQSGTWTGISLDAGSDGATGKISMNNVTIADAGMQNAAAVTCISGTITMTNSLQTGSAGDGVKAGIQCWGEVTGVTFNHDAGYVATISSNIVKFHDNTLNGGQVSLP